MSIEEIVAKSNHTLIIAGLDDFEATHIAEIFHEYKVKMLCEKLEAMVEDHKAGGGHRAEWFDDHLAWYDSIMTKMKWTKE